MFLRLLTLLIGIINCPAYEILSRGKPTEQYQTWDCHSPENCRQYESKNAVDESLNSCMRTRTIEAKSESKFTWWYVDLGGVKSIYSIRILFQPFNRNDKRQNGRFAGFSLYLSNSTNKEEGYRCYIDGPELPPLDFNTTCIGHGRYVIYYNERLPEGEYPEGYPDGYPEGFQEISITEICEVEVQGCNKTGMYGPNCNLRCPEACQERRCRIVDGTCLGCKPGFFGDSCDKECPVGKYGLECRNVCAGHCKGNVTCHGVTGQCKDGCAAGWTGTLCDKRCPDGTYGDNCMFNCSGHCLHEKPCNIISGKCDNGCRPGYTNDKCNQVCSAGYFGVKCADKCSEHCQNRNECDHVTGYCKSGCRDGYIGGKCQQACSQGHYGPNCSKDCSNTCFNNSCYHEDGHCNFGCKAGYLGFNCSQKCTRQTYGKNCKQNCTGHCVKNERCNHSTGFCDNGCANGFIGSLCDATCEIGYFGKNCSSVCPGNCSDHCNPVDGKCLCSSELSRDPYCKTVTEIKGREEFRNTEDTLTVGVSVGTSVLCVIALLSTILFLRFRRKWKKERLLENEEMTALPTEENRITPPVHCPKPFEKNTSGSFPTTPLFIDDGYANDLRGGLTRSNKTISTKDLENTIEKMSQDDDAAFKNEYKQIRKGELHPCLEAKKPENIPQNRYKTTYPYDHSRVILKEVLPKGSDYINANYIEDLQGQRSYIATQGPKPATICDFWSMVWQEDVKIIVCLTNLKEGTKIKCAQYWPDTGKIMKSGEFIIRNQNEIVYANYIRRTLCIKKNKDQKEVVVMMFHYTKWPDHGVPDPLSIIIFHRHVMRTSESCRGKYTLVHCSAGIGRTGTYIALDALYREGLKSGKVNVPKYVEIMRKDRMNMIQGHDQYKVVYLTLYESFRGKSKCISTDQFLQEYGNSEEKSSKSQLYSGFKKLVAIKQKYSAQDFGTGQSNIGANFTTSVLPVEEYMCRLTYLKDRGTYYNAVFLQSFTSNDSLISAQFPLPDYTEDFLRLLKDFNVHIAVFMCPLRNIKSSALWFPFQRKEKTVGPFRIKFIDSTAATNITMTDIALTKEGSSDTRLTVIECTAWKEGMSYLDHRTLLDVVKETQIEDVPSDKKILVLSSDGAKRCGPFCVVYNALQQISLDKEVDLFTITRLLQIRRPEFISTLDEYQICHEALAEYLQNDTVYANC